MNYKIELTARGNFYQCQRGSHLLLGGRPPHRCISRTEKIALGSTRHPTPLGSVLSAPSIWGDYRTGNKAPYNGDARDDTPG